MILSIGEILFDQFPDYRRLGGAPFNFACHVRRLGLPVRFVSRVGDDRDGREILKAVESLGLDPEDIQVDPDLPTGRVRVCLDEQGVPTFDILAGAAYDDLACTPRLTGLLERSSLIYHGTLIQRTPRGRETLMGILSRRPPNTRCLYDVNLRPGGYSRQTVLDGLKHADLLKLSETELDMIKGMHAMSGDADAAVAELMRRYGITWVALTFGPKGAALHTPAGRWNADPVRLTNLVDTVGAGDAFAAVLAAGCLKGLPPRRMVEAAVTLAAAMCTVKGALPPDGSTLYSAVLQAIRKG